MFSNISNKKVYEQVIEQIQDNIMDGTFKKGDKLPSERDLSETMGVSRTSIREALRVLETMGVVESRQGEGNFICSNIEKSLLQPLSMMFKLNEGSWSDIFELRNVLEIECARLSALRATELDCRELLDIVQKMEAETLNKNKTDELYVVGKIEELEALKDHPQVTLIDAREIFEMTENILAIRRKKESSLVKAMMLARNNEVDAVLSCGNTGAYYACAMLFLKRIKGIEKSCLMATIPTLNDKGVCMLDVGANAENTVDQLVQFAIMGNVYAKNVRHIQKPKVALLNIGSEEHKGDEIHKETYQSLSTLEQIDFVGNIEGKEILRGDVDVIVTDGFTGNVTLKTIEGVALSMMSALKDGFMASTRNKLGAVISKPVLKGLKTKFDPAGVGGALMMGFVKPVVKAHGASDAKAFESAMNLAFEMVEVNVVEKMKVGLDESGIR